MRAHVTPELVAVVRNRHYKRPSMTQKEIAEKVGCSAATVGRILAGKYDKKVDDDSDKMYTYGELDPKTGKVKTVKDTGNEQNFTLADPVRDENGKIHFVPRKPQKPDDIPESTTDSIPDPESLVETEDDIIATMTEKQRNLMFSLIGEALESGKTPVCQSSLEMLESRLDELDERFRRPPMEKDKFRYKVMTEIQTLRETQVDMYKELRQIKGILGELRDIWKK